MNEGLPLKRLHKGVRKGLIDDQNSDFENTPIFSNVENWLGFRPRLFFPSGQETMSASGFQTVFAVTYSDHSIPLAGFSIITVLKKLADVFLSLLLGVSR